ncbi:hypothetical protein IQ274_28490 [Nostoc sp. LEGE 12447]|nr:hypothetical protein [Nostoc sp. LEGE 12447]
MVIIPQTPNILCTLLWFDGTANPGINNVLESVKHQEHRFINKTQD